MFISTISKSVPFLLSSLFWKLSQPSRIHPLIFLWTPKRRGLSPQNLSWIFFLNLYIPLWLQKSFKFIVLSYCKYICELKTWICSFFLMTPKQNSPPDFYNYPPGRWELPIAPEQRFLKIFCPEQKRGWGDYGVEKITKLNKGQGYWSQVLINFTIFATFTFLFYILLCYNLASSMLKCEGSLT